MLNLDGLIAILDPVETPSEVVCHRADGAEIEVSEGALDCHLHTHMGIKTHDLLHHRQTNDFSPDGVPVSDERVDSVRRPSAGFG